MLRAVFDLVMVIIAKLYLTLVIPLVYVPRNKSKLLRNTTKGVDAKQAQDPTQNSIPTPIPKIKALNMKALDCLGGASKTSSEGQVPSARSTTINPGVVEVWLGEELPRRLGVDESKVGVQHALPSTVDLRGGRRGIRGKHVLPFLTNELLPASVRSVGHEREHVDTV